MDVQVARPQREQVPVVVRRGRAVLVQVVDHLRPFVTDHGGDRPCFGGLQGDVVAVDVDPVGVAAGVGGAPVGVGRRQHQQGRTGQERAGRPVLGERQVADRGQTGLASGGFVPVLAADQQDRRGAWPLLADAYEPEGAALARRTDAVHGDPVAPPVHRGEEVPPRPRRSSGLLARLEPRAGRAVRGLGGCDGERQGERGERRRHGRPAHRPGPAARGGGLRPAGSCDRCEPRMRAEQVERTSNRTGHQRLPPERVGRAP